MAKRTKKTESVDAAKKVDDVIEDATSSDETAPSVDDQPQEAEAAEAKVVAEESTKDVPTTKAETPPEAPREPTPAPAQPVESRENTVLLPLILGGAIAAGLGYGVAYLSRPQLDIPLSEQIATQATRIEALEVMVAALPEAVDLAPLSANVDDTAAKVVEVTDAQDRIDESLAALDTRLRDLEKQPSADGTLADTALAAYERELEALRAEITAQQESLAQVASEASAQLEATRAEAESIEQNAVENARQATARAALARVQGALESGAPIAAALTDLESALDDEVPAGLLAVAEGAPTINDLQASFPQAARAALAVARSEGVSGEADGGITSFLRNQFDVRSVAPKDGADVDSILSRAEAALRDGRMNEAFAELDALPEVSRAALTEWRAQAEARAAALAAADALSLSLNAN